MVVCRRQAGFGVSHLQAPLRRSIVIWWGESDVRKTSTSGCGMHGRADPGPAAVRLGAVALSERPPQFPAARGLRGKWVFGLGKVHTVVIAISW